MIEEIREKIMNRQLRVVDEDCEKFDYDNDTFVINFTDNKVTAGEVFNLPQSLETSWDEIREMILTDNFEDLEVVENMEIKKFTALEIKMLFTEELSDEEEIERSEEVRDAISDVVDDDLEKLHDIRMFFYSHFCSLNEYQNEVFNDTFEMDVIDSLEECYEEYTLQYIREQSAQYMLSGDADHLATCFEGITMDYDSSDFDKELATALETQVLYYQLDNALKIIKAYHEEDRILKFDADGKQVLEIDEFKFSDWLKNAWLHQHDGWNRDYWCDVSDMSFWDTCETKSTSFVNGGSVVLICHVSGDNNADYNSICDFCSSHDENYEHCCDAWEGYHESFPEDDFEDMQFDCMGNVGWTDNIKEEIEERLSENFVIEWV